MKRTYLEEHDLYLKRAVEMMAIGFNTKAAKKDCTGHLNRAYDAVRDHHNALTRPIAWEMPESERWDYFEAHDLPFGLHQYREAKHADRHHADALTREKCTMLVELRAEAMSMEIRKKAPSEIAIVRQAEKDHSEAYDDGFRVGGRIRAQSVWCHMFNGTDYVRHMWFNEKGDRDQFGNVMQEVATQRAFWELKDKPCMSKMTWQEIDAFYA